MQDIHSMTGGGGRLFSSTASSGVTGGGGGIDRRLRAHNLQSQSLKCPRCDSLNTKFCYYNNYNLSQPRHFCKNCRRYWTKGGVLRNVPVGGGCRKSTKRTSSSSKIKQSSATATTTETATATAEEGEHSNSHSNSDSSSLTTTKTAAADAVSSQQQENNISNNISNNNNSIFTFSDSSSKYLFPSNTRSYENQFSCTTMFTEMGSFTNLMNDNLQLPNICNTTTTNAPPPCTATNTLQNDNNLQFEPSTSEWNEPDTNSLITIPSGFLDQIDTQQNNNNRNIANGEGFPQFDWQQGGTNGEHSGGGGFFDLPSTTVDHAYWSQNQWSDNNDHHNLYLP